VLVTTTFDARPDYRQHHPDGSIWPLYLALCMGVTFIGSIFTPYLVLVGLGLSLIGIAGWGWTGSNESGPERVATPQPLTEGL
jgi:cytochrome c oxidase subunit 1